MNKIFEQLKGKTIVGIKQEGYSVIIEIEESDKSTIVLTFEAKYNDLDECSEMEVEAARKKITFEPVGGIRI